MTQWRENTCCSERWACENDRKEVNPPSSVARKKQRYFTWDAASGAHIERAGVGKGESAEEQESDKLHFRIDHNELCSSPKNILLLSQNQHAIREEKKITSAFLDFFQFFQVFF